MSKLDYLVAKAMKMPDGSWLRVRRRSVASRVTGTVAQQDLTAVRRGQKVGGMSLDARDGHVYAVHVNPEMRRKKVATQMWRRAKQSGLSPQHSDFRTADGDGWARAVGGRLPKNRASGTLLDEV